MDDRIPPRDKISIVTEALPEPHGWFVAVTISLLDADKMDEHEAMVTAMVGLARRLKHLGYDPIALLQEKPLDWGGAP